MVCTGAGGGWICPECLIDHATGLDYVRRGPEIGRPPCGPEFRVDAGTLASVREEGEARSRRFAEQASQGWLKLTKQVLDGAPEGMTHWRLTGTEQSFDQDKLQVVVTNKIQYGALDGVDEVELLGRGWTRIAGKP